MSDSELITDNYKFDDFDFAVNLAIARKVWREHRGLVEAAEFPEPYRTLYLDGGGTLDE